MTTVRIPGDIDQEDRLVAGLTARQLIIVAVPAIALWVAFVLTRRFVPPIVFAPVAVVVAGVVGATIVTKRDGISMDRFVLAAIRHHRAPHLMINAGGEARLPDGLTALNLPIVDISEDGVVDLGDEGAAVLLKANAVNLSLQSEREQQALTGAFGRFCNSLQGSVQFCVRTEPLDLRDAARRLGEQAHALPSVGLESAALDHARFLQELGGRHDVLRRVVILVLRDQHSIEQSAPQLLRRANDARHSLLVAGVELTPLSRAQSISALQRASAPSGAAQPFLDDCVMGV